MLATFGFTNFVEICLINAMSPFDAFPLLTAPFRHLHCQESQPASRQADRNVDIIECGAKFVELWVAVEMGTRDKVYRCHAALLAVPTSDGVERERVG